MKEAKSNKQPLPGNNTEDTDINRGEHKVGRAHQDDKYDISHMDRQEGAMHHGALGGNFECSEDNELGGRQENNEEVKK